MNQDQKILSRVERLASWLDTKFSIGKFSIGFDALIGFIPVVGDFTTSLFSFYIIYQANKFKISKAILLRMAFNVFLENIIGSIPIIGDLFDIYWKANTKNVNLLDRSLENPQKTSQKSIFFIVIFILLVVLTLISPFILLIAII